MSKVIVIGHTNPDTDNIAAAIAMANLLREEGEDARAGRKGNLNKETEWALEYSQSAGQIEDISREEIPQGQEAFLVDFNEEGQSPVDPSKIKLIGLIDHHKLAGNWKTEEPVLFRVEPIGSSSTLAAKMYHEKGRDIPWQLSKLLLCGIISDTLNLTSPTTTEEDKKWAADLANKVGENVDKLADSLFEAKSDLSAFTPEEIVKLDYKTFDFAGKKVGIGVIETVKPENIKKMEAEFKKIMREIKEKEKLDLIYLGIVDILKNETELLLISEQEKTIIMKSFSDIVISGDNLILKGIVSRKKQIAPAMERAIKEIEN